MTDHFERLGLPRRFSIDGATLESAYLVKSREVHPDFHALTSHEHQQASLRDTAAVNEAYLVLKDPFRRADYLLGILGGPTATQQKDMPQIFLMEMMDLREQIEDVKRSADATRQAKTEAELSARLGKLFQNVEKLFAQEPTPLIAIRRELNAAKVLKGLLRDLRD